MDAPNAELADQCKADLIRVTTAIEQLTGLPTNWNGQFELIPVDATYFGLKNFACGIQLRADVAIAPDRWRTLIHEAFHAVSAGYSVMAFLDNVGWEEGTVEQLQRLFRMRILAHMGIIVDESLFAPGDHTHSFNRYIRALETIRACLSTAEDEFYLSLITTPIAQRYRMLFETAMNREGDARKQMLAVLSAANSTLKEGRRELR